MSQFAKKLRADPREGGQRPSKPDKSAKSCLRDESQAAETAVHRDPGEERGRHLERRSSLALISKSANIPRCRPRRSSTVNKEVLDVESREDVAKRLRRLPGRSRLATIITIAVANPFDVLKLDDIRIITGCQLRPVVVSTEEEIERDDRSKSLSARKPSRRSTAICSIRLRWTLTSRAARKTITDEDSTRPVGRSATKTAPVVKTGQQDDPRRLQSGRLSDIHIEPFEKKVIVRYRKDGTHGRGDGRCRSGCRTTSLRASRSCPSWTSPRRQQAAGRQVPDEDRSTRRSTSACRSCRSSGARRLCFVFSTRRTSPSTSRALGFEEKSAWRTTCGRVRSPYGMILVTGPTGSGKSTTLYSAVSSHCHRPKSTWLRSKTRSNTQLEGINQVPVNPEGGG